MRNIKIAGYGTYIPENFVKFGNQIRHRVVKEDNITQIDMAVEAINKALENAKLEIEDIDCIVSTSAVCAQLIPCTAALIHEKIAKGTNIPAMDINTTCTSFISALDIMSYLIEAGRYKRVLIVASEKASIGLNKNQKESYELFADGACAIIFEKSNDKKKGVIYSLQQTWSEGAHSTEIRGGGTLKPSMIFDQEHVSDYLFDMKGKEVLLLAARKLPKFFKTLFKESGLGISDIDMVIPHQASRALELIMKKLGIPKEKYIDIVQDYGNMVSVSVPFTFCKALEAGKVKEGDTIILTGTAAGLTANAVILKI